MEARSPVRLQPSFTPNLVGIGRGVAGKTLARKHHAVRVAAARPAMRPGSIRHIETGNEYASGAASYDVRQ
jgi:hypothetical protein